MASVNDEINRISGAKTDIKNAIEYCGVEVSEDELIDEYAEKIRNIPTNILSNLNVESSPGEFVKSIKQTNGLIEVTMGGLVNSTQNGLVPKIETPTKSISTLADEWVLTSVKGATPIWCKLPSAANALSGEAGTSDVNRHVWFSHATYENKRCYDDDFMYNPSTNTLTVTNVNGNATFATTLGTSSAGYTYSTLTTALNNKSNINHTHDSLKYASDTRSVATIPSDYKQILKFVGIKTGATMGLTDSFVSVIGWKGYTDQSGPKVWELASGNNRLYVRPGTWDADSWGEWKTLAYTSELSAYLPLAGGKMSGNIILNGIKSSSTSTTTKILMGETGAAISSTGTNVIINPSSTSTTGQIILTPGSDSKITINAKKVATEQYVDNEIAELVDSAPETLNTLNELAAALNDDANFSTTITNLIGLRITGPTSAVSENIVIFEGETGKVVKDSGKKLSDFSVSGHNHDSVYKKIQDAVTSPAVNSSTNSFIDTISQDTQGVITATKKTLSAASSLTIGGIKIGKDNSSYTVATNTSPTITANVTTAGKYYAVEIDKNDKAYVYVPWTNTTYSVATQSANGLMSAADKTKLDGITVTINSGTANKLAYYSGANTIDDYTSTKGSTTKGIYLNAGVPTQMTYSLSATVNSGTSSRLAYYSGANAISSYSIPNSVGNQTTVYVLGSYSSAVYYSPNVTVKNGTTLYASGGFYESSDNKLKNFKENIEINFEKLKQLPKKYFTWKSDESDKLNIGTSAQELQKLYPELVSEDENGLLHVAYDKLSIIALSAIDKLYEEICELKSIINNLQNK